jgi:hypothetical protein
LNRYGVDVAVHGHAHRGSPEGRTAAGIPVYNVSLPLLRRQGPDAAPVRLLELPLGGKREEGSGKRKAEAHS